MKDLNWVLMDLNSSDVCGRLEAGSLSVDRVALEWVTSSTLSMKSVPATGDIDGLALLGQTVDGVAVVAPATVDFVQVSRGSPLTVWKWVGDLLASGGPGSFI